MNDQARATSGVTLRVDRIAAFSDAVLAIATTLLVLGLEIPSVHKIPEKKLPEYLLASVPSVLGYITSFLLVGMYWLQHFVIFHYVTRANRVFILLNGLFLLCVTFLPFPTGLQAAYRGDVLAELLYGCTHILCGLGLLSLWLYASRGHRLIAPETAPKIVTSMTRRICVIPIMSAVAIAASFVNVWAGKAIFLAIPAFYFSHRLVDAGWHEIGTARGDLPEKTP
jgi:uncharacterized membrane protein